MCECVYILICWLAKLRKLSFTGKNKIIKFYKKAYFKERQYAKAIVRGSRREKRKTLQPRRTTGYHPKWALTDSNRRPSACKADALNQLS